MTHAICEEAQTAMRRTSQSPSPGKSAEEKELVVKRGQRVGRSETSSFNDAEKPDLFTGGGRGEVASQSLERAQ